MFTDNPDIFGINPIIYDTEIGKVAFDTRSNSASLCIKIYNYNIKLKNVDFSKITFIINDTEYDCTVNYAFTEYNCDVNCTSINRCNIVLHVDAYFDYTNKNELLSFLSKKRINSILKPSHDNGCFNIVSF